MAEEYGEKTEAPTPRRRTEAREQGNIPRSVDLTSAAIVLSVMILLNWFGGGLVHALRSLASHMLGAGAAADLRSMAMGDDLVRSIAAVGWAMLPVLGGIILVAIVVNLAQVGLNFHGQRLAPNLGALNPMKGIGRLLGQGRGAFQLLMNLLKLLLVAAVGYSAVRSRMEQIVSVQQLSFLQVFALGAQIIYAIALRIGVLLLLLAIVDYIFQRWRIERELRMTRQEVKEEMKRMDGDPQVKNRRRQIAMQIARNRLRNEVPRADVVVTNPTEFAVALKYDPQAMSAPRVIAKGQGYMAQQIRQIAVAHGIPILERKPLARALFRLVEVGGEIPEQFYQAVAEILAYVYELTGRTRSQYAGA